MSLWAKFQIIWKNLTIFDLSQEGFSKTNDFQGLKWEKATYFYVNNVAFKNTVFVAHTNEFVFVRWKKERHAWGIPISKLSISKEYFRPISIESTKTSLSFGGVVDEAIKRLLKNENT